jgi:hypothetical protein
MIGGWRPWERFKAARRLARHAQLEGGEPPPDLLRWLRADIPDCPAMAYVPAAGRGERRGVSRPWLVAASLAVALAAGVIGLRVWDRQLRLAGDASMPPGASARPGAEAASGPPSPRPPQAVTEPSAPPALAPRSDAAAPPRVQAPPRQPSPQPVDAPAPGFGRSEDSAPPLLSGPPRVSAPRPPSASPPASGPPAPPLASAPPPVMAPALGQASGDGAAAGSASKPEIAMAAEEPQAAARPKALDRAAAAPAPPERQVPGATSLGGAPVAPPARTGSATVPRKAAPASPATAKAKSMPATPQPALTPPAAVPAAAAASGWLRSSFGTDTGTGSYRRLRHDLLDEGRLPRAASVRAGELANAFDLAAGASAPGGPELLAEGAPLPAAANTWLLRFDARGLRPSPGQDAVEVDFDVAVVARFHRVGATTHRGVAAALYEVELRPSAASAPPAAPSAASPSAASQSAASPPTASPPAGGSGQMAAAPARPAGSRQTAAAPSRSAGERRTTAASASGGSGAPAGDRDDRVVAVLRAVSRERPDALERPAENVGGLRQDPRERGLRGTGQPVLAERVVRLSDLRPSWDAASPALRASALAIELAETLAAKDPAPRLRELRARGQALAAELPDDPKVAELLRLIQRAADLAGASDRPSHQP